MQSEPKIRSPLASSLPWPGPPGKASFFTLRCPQPQTVVPSVMDNVAEYLPPGTITKKAAWGLLCARP